MSERNLLVGFMLDARFKVGVIIFGSVFTYKNQPNQIIFYRKQLKLSLTDQF
jgi:hypothetical protein